MNEKECPFLMHVSKDGDAEGLVIKTLILEHTCCKHREVPSASQGYLAKYFKQAVYRNPKYTSKDMQGHVKDHLKLHVSLAKCKRAKNEIICNLEGSYKEEFSRLCAYIEKVNECMPGSRLELQLSTEQLQAGKRVFKRLFVMLEPCRLNWLGGCRKLISLDGCHLKGATFGCLLTTVGKDGNEGIVPIAWAVVNKENKNNWRWFMNWLKQGLELGEGDEGLMEAIKEITPQTEHRWCARHIYANWSKKWRGEELKKRFWIAAWSSYHQEFKLNLAKISAINKKATYDLMHYQAFQSPRCSTFMVDNNISESFNANISEARHKPIISMLENIRVMVMSRIRDRRSVVNGWKSIWCPNAMKQYEENKQLSIECNVLLNGDSGYEVSDGEDKHIVFVDRRMCTCRVWELTGIPCPHAIAAFYSGSMDPLSVMSHWYTRDTYLKCCKHTIQPILRVKFWNMNEDDAIEPPPVEKKVGRPKKNRVRATNEPKLKHKLSRKGKVQHCSVCGSMSHKKDSCPQRPSHLIKESQASTSSKPTKKSGRKRSNSGVGLYVNEKTGKQLLLSGRSSSIVIDEGNPRETDPQTRFPIPNESKIRKEKRQRQSTEEPGPTQVKKEKIKPFKAPKWKKADDQQAQILRRSPRWKNIISTLGFTTTG
ncbi:uncharacterized protein LOC130994270 [Salvia miltiorrhiza]|uniref:uncharacterized protein LOC130994270 n=1 Tax=Salvia miltiorrhiza TaxID=226208 RepID=UPI0025AD23CD|nr:uncharacterized protein LOC130994270 [Salvia miltiorrhiza]